MMMKVEEEVPERSIQEVMITHKERVRDKFKPSLLPAVRFKKEENSAKLFKALQVKCRLRYKCRL